MLDMGSLLLGMGGDDGPGVAGLMRTVSVSEPVDNERCRYRDSARDHRLVDIDSALGNGEIEIAG